MFHVWDIFKSAWLAECSDIYTPARAQNVWNCCWRGPQESLSNFSWLSSYRMKKIRLGRLRMQTCSQYICVHSKDPNLSTLLYCSTRQLCWYWEVTHFKECSTSYIIFFSFLCSPCKWRQALVCKWGLSSINYCFGLVLKVLFLNVNVVSERIMQCS